MIANVELIAATVRLLLENKGYSVYPTYPPETKQSHVFGPGKDAMYVRVICLTQRVTNNEYNRDYYLFYRNKITKAGHVPEFSSTEFGYFDNSKFNSLFKLHKVDADGNEIEDEVYAASIVEKIRANVEGDDENV